MPAPARVIRGQIADSSMVVHEFMLKLEYIGLPRDLVCLKDYGSRVSYSTM